MAICNNCPLLINKWYGKVCNRDLWYNPKTKALSSEEQEDYIRGCGCRLEAKTRDLDSECPMNKW